MDDRSPPRLPGGRAGSLKHVRAAQLRTRMLRRAVGQVLLGSVFLVGALAYAWAPDRHSQGSTLWMSGLVILSTVDVGLGLRTMARVRRLSPRWWIAAAVAWGGLSVVLLGYLLRR